MNINLYVLNAQGKLSDLDTLIRGEFHEAVRKITSLMSVDNVDVVINASQNVIPETGIAAFCPEDDLVSLQINPENPNLLDNFSGEFSAMLGHELHHCMRRRGPGYGNTLGEALVTEGLACCFETELRAGNVPFYANAFSENELAKLWKKAISHLDSESYDHRAWFFGGQPDYLPRHSGYSLGFYLVRQYIKMSGEKASGLCCIPASNILNHSDKKNFHDSAHCSV